MKLLELTSGRSALNANDLGVLPQLGLDSKLRLLVEDGVITICDGVFSMDGDQRLMLAEQLIHSGFDPKKVSKFLRWQEFEDFTEHTLSKNGFSTRKHLIFKSSARRMEIDILAWNDTLILAVDCKHWLRGLSPGRMREAARAQVERAVALAHRPELLYRLKIEHPEKLSIIPAILALGELRERLVDRVPIISISKLLSFIYGVSPIDDDIKRIPVPMLQSHFEI
jgi:hypothetical protein